MNYRPMSTICPRCGLGGWTEGENCACGYRPVPEMRSRSVESRKLTSGRQALLTLIAMRDTKTPKTVQERLIDLYELRRGWTW